MLRLVKISYIAGMLYDRIDRSGCDLSYSIYDITSISLPDKLEVERRDIPWLHVGSGNHCEGTKLYRLNRRVVTVPVPCFLEPQEHGICCPRDFRTDWI